MAREGIHGPERDAEAVVTLVLSQVAGDRADVADRVALVVAVVHPDRVQAGPARFSGPSDDVFNVAACRKTKTDSTTQRGHRSSFPQLTLVARRVSSAPVSRQICY